jgi:hypothetical protein
MKDLNKMGRSSDSMISPPQSASRALDQMVAAQELPYGYTSAPPPYWHQNAEAIENQKLQKKGKYGP